MDLQNVLVNNKLDIRVIPCEITHSKNESQKMNTFRLFSYLVHKVYNVHPIRFHNPEYQPPVTSGFRVT